MSFCNPAMHTYLAAILLPLLVYDMDLLVVRTPRYRVYHGTVCSVSWC